MLALLLGLLFLKSRGNYYKISSQINRINLLTLSFLDLLLRFDGCEELSDESSSSSESLLSISESEEESFSTLLRFDFFFFDLRRGKKESSIRLEFYEFLRDF